MTVSGRGQAAKQGISNAGMPSSLLTIFKGGVLSAEQAAGTIRVGGPKAVTPTVTRSTIKYAQNSSGVYVSQLANVAAIEADGILAEAAATNIMLQSEDFNHGAWGAAGGNTGTTPVATSQTADCLAPNGTQTAVKIALGASSGAANAYSCFGQTVNTGAGVYTYSAWIRVLSGTGTCYIMRGDAFTEPQTTCNLTSTWQRFTCTMTNTSANHVFQIGYNRLNAGETAQPALNIYVWGVQLETGPIATSYMLTAAASATRNRDVISLTNPLVSSSWAVAATLKQQNWTNVTSYAFGIGTKGSANSAWLELNTDGKIYGRTIDNASGVKDISISHGFTNNTAHRVRFINAAGTLQLYLDGVLAAAATTGAGTGIITTQGPTMYIGTSGGTDSLNGWITDVSVANSPTGAT